MAELNKLALLAFGKDLDISTLSYNPTLKDLELQHNKFSEFGEMFSRTWQNTNLDLYKFGFMSDLYFNTIMLRSSNNLNYENVVDDIHLTINLFSLFINEPLPTVVSIEASSDFRIGSFELSNFGEIGVPVTILKNGASHVETEIVFTFSNKQEIKVYFQIIRTKSLNLYPNNSFKLDFKYETVISKTINNGEKRISLNDKPTVTCNYNYDVDEVFLPQLFSMIAGEQKAKTNVHDLLNVVSIVGNDTKTLPLNPSLAKASKLAVYKSDYSVIEAQVENETDIILTDFNFEKDERYLVCPIKEGLVTAGSTIKRYNVNLLNLDREYTIYNYKVSDVKLGDKFIKLKNNYALFFNYTSMTNTNNHNLEYVRLGSVLPDVYLKNLNSEISHTLTYNLSCDEHLLQFVKFLDELKGSLHYFWLPDFMYQKISLDGKISAKSNNVKINSGLDINKKYAIFIEHKSEVILAEVTELVSKVNSSTLVLDYIFKNNINTNEDVKITLLRKVRIADDKFTVRRESTFNSTVSFNVTEVI